MELDFRIRKSLEQLGENLKLARKRRRETQEQFANRIGVSRQTLSDMEVGSPSVTLGNYARVLWALGMEGDLAKLANPDEDRRGLYAAREREPERVRPRSRSSGELDF